MVNWWWCSLTSSSCKLNDFKPREMLWTFSF